MECYNVKLSYHAASGHGGYLWHVEDDRGVVYLRTSDKAQAMECYQRMRNTPKRKYPGVPADYWQN